MSITKENKLGNFDILDEIVQTDTTRTLLNPQTAVMISYTAILFGFMRIKTDPGGAWFLIVAGIFAGITMMFYIKLSSVQAIANKRYLISHTYLGDFDADEQLQYEDIVTILSSEEDEGLEEFEGEFFEDVLIKLGVDSVLEAPTIQRMLEVAIEKRAKEFFEQPGRIARLKRVWKGIRKKENNNIDGEINDDREGIDREENE